MTTEPLTCPYCNAAINVQPGLTPGPRITCPRCGDTFPFRPLDGIAGQPRPAPMETGFIADAPPPSIPRRQSKWLIGGGVLGLMLLMAGGGLAFMLMTQGERRAHDTSRPPRRPGKQLGVPEPDLVAVPSVSPDKLAALGYLPSGVNFLVGARVAELLASSVGIQMLRDPIRIGKSEYRLTDLPALMGLRLEDIDHFVFAAKVDNSLIPPFYLVIRTAQPYDDESMRQKLKDARVVGGRKKKLYSFQPRPNVKLYARFVDDRTLVVALFPEQLESLPEQPIEDLRQLPDELQKVLKERREPIAPLWTAGHSRDWSKTVAKTFLSRMKKDDLERLAPLRTFGIWVVPEKSLEVKAVFACKDEAGARGLGEYFRSLRGDDPAFKTAQDGSWLTLQFQTDPDILFRSIQRR